MKFLPQKLESQPLTFIYILTL